MYKWRIEDNPSYEYNNYVQLLRDRRRNIFYKKLIQSVQSKTVLDFGCGIPILSKMSLEAGAEKVYAIDQNPNLIPYLEELRMSYPNNFEYFITDDRNLPDISVDYVISEIYGSNLYHENLFHVFENCKKVMKDSADFLPKSFRLSCALTNIDDINKQTKNTLGTSDEFNWCKTWDIGNKTSSHIKYWFPLDTSVLSYQSTSWFSFKKDIHLQSFKFTFSFDKETHINLVNIMYEIGHDNLTLSLNKTNASDSWGNQFIRLPERKLKSDELVQFEIYVLDDYKHIGARWI